MSQHACELGFDIGDDFQVQAKAVWFVCAQAICRAPKTVKIPFVVVTLTWWKGGVTHLVKSCAGFGSCYSRGKANPGQLPPSGQVLMCTVRTVNQFLGQVASVISSGTYSCAAGIVPG